MRTEKNMKLKREKQWTGEILDLHPEQSPFFVLPGGLLRGLNQALQNSKELCMTSNAATNIK